VRTINGPESARVGYEPTLHLSLVLSREPMVRLLVVTSRNVVREVSAHRGICLRIIISGRHLLGNSIGQCALRSGVWNLIYVVSPPPASVRCGGVEEGSNGQPLVYGHLCGYGVDSATLISGRTGGEP